MKKILKKFKKLDKKFRIMFYIISILYLVSIIFISQGLLLLKNIETVLRIVFLIFIYLSYFIYLFISILLLFSKRSKSYVANSIFVSLVSVIFIIFGVYLNKTYNIVDRMNKDVVTYSSSLVVMKDTTFKNDSSFTVGMISDENDIEGNILANKLIDKKKLDKIDIKYYDNYLEMLGDLYSKSIDGILVSSGYVVSFSGYDNYNNIGDETKIIYTYKEKRKNISLNSGSGKKLTEPFTILLLGVDSEVDGLKANQAFNGDTMMMITFNPTTLNTTVFSIPRDTYAPIACNGKRSNKINSSAAGGTTCVINTLKDLTGIDIDYYVKINFKGVVDLVEALDGIEVDVPVDFCEQDSNREFGEHEICLKKGVQTLNGEAALALSRHRHSLPLGDFQRVQHQQLVVEAMAKKVKNIRSVNKFYEVLDAISKNIETNVSTDEMLNLYNVGKKMLLENDANINIEKTYLTGYDLTMLIPGLGNVYTFQYYPESLNEIVKAMKVNLGLEEPTMIKTFNFSANYTYEVPVIGKQYYSVKRNEALPSFVGSSITYLNTWADARGITVNVNYITDGMDGYDSNKDGIIINQNVSKGTLVSEVKSITVSVVKSSKSENDVEETKNTVSISEDNKEIVNDTSNNVENDENNNSSTIDDSHNSNTRENEGENTTISNGEDNQSLE